VYDVDRDGFISNGELFLVLKMMVGNNLKVNFHQCAPYLQKLMICQDQQLQQIVDKTIMEADLDGDGKLSFEEFAQTVSNTVRVFYYSPAQYSLTSSIPGYCQANDLGRSLLTAVVVSTIQGTDSTNSFNSTLWRATTAQILLGDTLIVKL
jgi:hypothetical protein